MLYFDVLMAAVQVYEGLVCSVDRNVHEKCAASGRWEPVSDS